MRPDPQPFRGCAHGRRRIPWEAMSILAADLGGTRSRVVVAAANGDVIARAEAGPGNPVRVGMTQASEGLRVAAAEALGAAGDPPIAAAAIGMAGCSHPAASRVVGAALDALGVRPAIRILVDDGAIAFRSVFSEPRGVLVMAGTGSGARARGENGTVIFGGWGADLGDERSAHDIGRQAVRSCLRAAQLGERLSACGRDVLAHAGVTEVRLLPDLVRGGQLGLADLCAVVMGAAGEGDQVACAIIAEAARALYVQASTAGLAAGVPEGTPLATAGSVLACAPIRERLNALCADGRFVVGAHVEDPVLGALALAREALADEGTVPPGW